MAQILIRLKDNSHSDPTIDLKCYKKGMPVVVMDDNHVWGNKEKYPDFFVIKVPGISVDTVNKYISPEEVQNGFEDDGVTPRMEMYRRRLWQIQYDSLPNAAKNLISTNGEVIIKAGSYNGSYDYTWAQVKNYFKNLKTNTVETVNI